MMSVIQVKVKALYTKQTQTQENFISTINNEVTKTKITKNMNNLF